MIKSNVERGKFLAASRETERAFLKDLMEARLIDEMVFNHQNPEMACGQPYKLSDLDDEGRVKRGKTESPFTDDSAERKNYPVYSGFIAYFPDAVLNVWKDPIPMGALVVDTMAEMLASQEWTVLAKLSLIHLEYQLTGGLSSCEPSSLYEFLMDNKNAVAALCNHSKKGNDKHNPGEPLHWSRDESNDHEDCIGRHLIDQDWLELSWRCFAKAQIELEKASNEGLLSFEELEGIVKKMGGVV